MRGLKKWVKREEKMGPYRKSRMKSPRLFSGLAFAMLFLPTLVFAQQAAVVEEEKFSLLVGERTWLSKGKSDFNIAGVGGVPNVLSELIWDDVDSTVVELSANALFYQRWMWSVEVGFGAISGGTLRDLDFFGNNRTFLFSESISTADDDGLFYVSVDLGYRILSWAVRDKKPRSSLDLLIGYQHWREKYIATKGVQTQDPFGLIGFVGPFPDQGKAITEDFTWDSLRVGARANIEILPKFSFRGRLLFVPWTHFKLEDIHHLRTDLRQDPSSRATADGGFGVLFDATLSYNVWRGLSIEAGYQLWDISSGEGTITARSLIVGDVQEPFNEANSTRHGLIIGINYLF